MSPLLENARSFIGDLEAVLEADDVAALLVRPASVDEHHLARDIETIKRIVQDRGVALLIDGRPELAVRSGADGAHCCGVDALLSGLRILKPERIAGAGGLKSRHDAMVAGEAGADYVMFGEPDAAGRRPAFDAVLERVGWWAELFEPPCVAYAASLDEVAALARAGADFIAVGDMVWGCTGGPAAGLDAVVSRLRAMESIG